MNINFLPFYYQSNIDKNNGGYPDIFPFEIYYDQELEMFRQRETQSLASLLHEVYLKGSLVDGSLANNTGANYISKVQLYIESRYTERINSVLEIGSGTGLLLTKIKANKKVAVEPGEHSQMIDSSHSDIETIKDFFPTKLLTDKFDLILHFAVLEHISDPITFLVHQKNILTNNGKIILGVPNEEVYVQNGDIGMFIHEHYNYFTVESLCKTVEKAGLYLEHYDYIEGMIVATISQIQQPLLLYKKINHVNFFKEAEIIQGKLEFFLRDQDPLSIALYAPSRALNFLYLLNIKDIRLVDDNPEVHNKYLPYLNRHIENFSDLVDSPPAKILIFSRTFGVQIINKCRANKKLSNTEIYTLNDL